MKVIEDGGKKITKGKRSEENISSMGLIYHIHNAVL